MLATDLYAPNPPAAILSLGFSAGMSHQGDFYDYVQDTVNYQNFDTFRASTPIDTVINEPLEHASDGILILCMQDGNIELGGEAMSARAGRGDTLIADMSHEAKFATPGFDARCLLVSKAHLSENGFDTSTLHLQKISGKHTVARLLNNHVFDLHASAHLLSESETNVLLKPTLSLVQAALNNEHGPQFQTAEENKDSELLKVRQFIEQNLNSPDLSVDWIATELAMSRAKLYRLAEPLGGIKRFIRNHRLEQAYARLTNGQGRAVSISSLAYDLGFGSENAFRRSFKETYGVSPRSANRISTHAANAAL